MTQVFDPAPSVAWSIPHVDRNRLFGGLFALGFLNAAASPAVDAIGDLGLLGAALALFNISAVVWMAMLAALALCWQTDDAPAMGSSDGPLTLLVVAAALSPWPTASGVALTLAGLWAAVTAPRGSALSRAALIILAVSGSLIWGKLLLTLFTRPVLEIDTWLVGIFLGVHQDGNVVWREGGSVTAVVSTGCSSIHGVSIAIVCWTALSQFFKVPLGTRAWLTLAFAVLATMAINIGRIGGILVSPEWAHVIHDGWGVSVVMWLTLAAVVSICLFGLRREVFARA